MIQFLLLLATYLQFHLGGVVADNIIIHYNNAFSPNVTAYTEFITSLRAQLTSGYHAHGIPVLRQYSAATSQRFILVQLENGAGNIIIVPVDVVNVGVVGYLVGGNTFFYFTNTPREAVDTLFPGAQRRPLGYSSNYGDLGNRGTVKLGHASLNHAILDLSNDFPATQKASLLVIIQMVSDAARIRYIEHLIRRNMISNVDFIPDFGALSLEDSWSDLSEQIQLSGSTGVFSRRIEIRDSSNHLVQINNIQAVFRGANPALLLYQCHINPTTFVTSPNNIIRMPVAAVGDVSTGNEGWWCPMVEPTTNIIGPGELCADVRLELDKDGTPVQLYPCGNNLKRNQQWTFKTDGTIRSLGKCLTTHAYTVFIYDCGLAAPEDTQWELTNVGSIVNPRSQVALAAKSSLSGTNLTVTTNTNSTKQAWKAGNYTQPVVTYISGGFNQTCLQANSDNTGVLLATCVTDRERKQQWALYSDNTIRLYSDRNQCLTSNGHNIGDNIILLQCDGRGNQRWSFRADGTILNPNAKLVMEINKSNVPQSRQIILSPPTGNPHQLWLAFF